jgi:hypothetical protein
MHADVKFLAKLELKEVERLVACIRERVEKGKC